MSRLALGTLLVFAVLGCSSAQGPLLFLNLADSLTLKFQYAEFWINRVNGDPDSAAEETLRKIKELSGKMDSLRTFFNQKIDSAINEIVGQTEKSLKFNSVFKSATDAHRLIDAQYQYFFDFLNGTINKGSIDGYLEVSDGEFRDLKNAIATLYGIIKSGRSLINELDDIINYLAGERCNQEKSTEQWLFYFFNEIILSEVRAYALMCFQRGLKIGYGKEEQKQFYTEELARFKKRFRDRIRIYGIEFPKALNRMRQDIRRCDFPNTHLNPAQRGRDYFEFEKLYQGYLINSDQVEFPCPKCDDIKSHPGHLVKAEAYGFRYEVVRWKNPIHQKCNGEIRNCKSVTHPKPRDLEVCLRPEDELRRYDWIYDDQYHESTFGTNKQTEYERNCYGGSVKKIPTHQHVKDSQFAFTNGGVKPCYYCLCTCAENNATTSRAIRAVSLRKQESNASLNRVVIGVRLVQQDNMVHIQIKEGQLLQNGKVENVKDNNTKGWVPLERMNIKKGYFTTRDNLNKAIGENREYAYIDKFNDTLLLDDYMIKENLTIIGVAFRVVYNPNYKWRAIGLNIKTVPFNWSTGKLDLALAEWTWTGTYKEVDIWNIEHFREIQVNESIADDPFKSIYSQPVLERAPIKFHISDFVKDAGQSVWPYFDSQEVVTNPSFPLGGISLFQRGANGFSGFIAPKIHTVKITADQMKQTIESIQNNVYS